MVRYFYAWTPLVVVFGAVILLTIPFLALIALMIVSLVAVAALAWAIVSVPRMFSRAISRRWYTRTSASPPTAAALSPASSSVPPTRAVPTGATALLAHVPSERHTT
jgi:hypothetical protein